MASIFKLRHQPNGEKSRVLVEHGGQLYITRPRDFVLAAEKSPLDMTDVAVALAALLERGLATLSVQDDVRASSMASLLPTIHKEARS